MADPVAFAFSYFYNLCYRFPQLDEIASSVISRVRDEMQACQDELDERVSRGQNGSICYAKRRQIAREITELSYWLENTLDASIINAPQADQRRQAGRCIPIHFPKTRRSSAAKDLLQILDKIKAIKARLPSRLSGLSAQEEGMTISGNVVTYQAHEFVKRMTEMNELLGYLCKDEMCQVITISGIGGVGKTTLAQQLFEHEGVLFEYPTRIWVTVSPEFQPTKIFTGILGDLESALGHDLNFPDTELARRISDILCGSKVLIVLDDICSLEVWDSLRIILPSVNRNEPTPCKSKILITTRVKKLAETVTAARSNWVHLNRLTDEEGCTLLEKNVPDLRMGKDLQMKIVNFCGGLPLTIVSFLRSMVSKHTLAEWEEMVNQRLNCASNRRLELPEIRTTMEVLASSYDGLQDISKLYFLYMGVLQKDLRVEEEKLHLFLLADMFVYGGALFHVYGGAGFHVDGLAERGMVDLDEEEVPTITGFKYGRLTEIMRDLSLFKNEDECFFKVLEFGHQNQAMPDSLSSLPRHRTYRVAINFDEYERGYDFPLTDDEKKHLRVLVFSAKGEHPWPSELSSLAKFKYLRILDFNGFNFETKLPGGVARAVYLRYLSFKDCILRELPSSIGNLKFLSILDLRVQQSTTMIIPDILWKLKKLRHLYFPVLFKTRDGIKLRLKGLIKLETITNYKAKMFDVEDLLGLRNLQYLDSNVDGNLEEVKCIIELMMKRSQSSATISEPRSWETSGSLSTSLQIRNFDCYTEERHCIFRRLLACEPLRILRMDGHIRRMPMHDNFSQNLTKIEFIGSQLIEDPMRTLEKLPKLCGLVLNDAFVGEEIVCSASGFVKLKLLRLLNLLHLKKWVVENGAMPRLSTLEIANCGKLEMSPEGLQYVHSRRELKVSGMSQDFKKRTGSAWDETASTSSTRAPCIIFED